VVSSPSYDYVPSFSQDGKWVYFASDRRGRNEIYRVAATGCLAEQITDKGGYTAFESKDGSSLYYTKSFAGCTPLFVRSLDGGHERQMGPVVCNRALAITERGMYYITSVEPG
jgi:Tol biopolymer transport system component